jgi:hypothetical protein
MKLTATVMVLLVVLAVPCYAQQDDDYLNSDRPGIADSSEVVGAGRIQLETGVQRGLRKTGEDPRRMVFLPTLLRVGISESWEVRLESDIYAWLQHADGARSEGYAPASFGFKHRFLEGAGTRPSLALVARVSPPSGSNALRTRRATGDVRLAADWELGSQWSFNPNIGWTVDEDEGRRFSARLIAMTLAYKPMRRLEIFADMAAQTPEAKGGRTAQIYDAGAAYLLDRDTQVDVSMGIRGAGSTPPRNFLAAGFSRRF